MAFYGKPYAGKPIQDQFLTEAAAAGFPAGSIIDYKNIDAIVSASSVLSGRPWWLVRPAEHRAGRAKWKLPAIGDVFAPAVSSESKVKAKKVVAPKVSPAPVDVSPPAPEPVVAPVMKVSSINYSAVPEKSKNFVPFGHFSDLKRIVKSNFFYPTFITGMSGNGKTFAVEQAAAAADHELFRVNVTVETDEDDLLGGFRLVDGETRWFDGPVIEAMRRGAILLLDEIDLASNRIMCLQPVLEGKPVLLKKINEIISPADGFTIIATANTKGKGSDDGRYIGTNVLNDAFLERFAITFEWDYPTAAIEKRIIRGTLKGLGVPNPEYADKLVNWAGITRASFAEGAADELIATRRLEKIAQAFAIFGDETKAVSLALNRFDDDTKESFLDLWEKISGNLPIETVENPEESEAPAASTVPF